jgi:23S rRNA C2498 (ribose-2'-O)-methylase RlmM
VGAWRIAAAAAAIFGFGLTQCALSSGYILYETLQAFTLACCTPFSGYILARDTGEISESRRGLASRNDRTKPFLTTSVGKTMFYHFSGQNYV